MLVHIGRLVLGQFILGRVVLDRIKGLVITGLIALVLGRDGSALFLILRRHALAP
jgi:hypothetical protein